MTTMIVFMDILLIFQGTIATAAQPPANPKHGDTYVNDRGIPYTYLEFESEKDTGWYVDTQDGNRSKECFMDWYAES